jgi:hypothetical protein
MPLYVIERNYAEQLELSASGVREVEEINAEEGTRWVLVPDGGQAQVLLRVRGLLARRDHRRRPPGGPAGRCDRPG